MDRTMQTETNRRGFTQHFVERRLLKLSDLQKEARDAGLDHKYLYRVYIPEYPKPEFQVSLLKHDTTGSGLEGIREDGGFRDPYGGSLIWWSLAVGPEEMKDAELRLLEKTFPDQTEEEAAEQQNFLWRFATSPAFLETSRLGSYRFTFPLEEVLTAYRDQYCCGAQPVMRMHRTVLYTQEVMHVVLVHSPANEEFSRLPLLSDDPDAVCVYRDGRFIWRPEAMCASHRYKLIHRHQTRQMDAWSIDPQFYVWDHVAVALHVGQNQMLKFNLDQLRTNLKFCQPDVVNYGSNGEDPDDFDGAKRKVKRLWPAWSGPLEMQSSLKQSLTVSDVQLVLVGWPGVGKSSSGNTILGRTAFRTSSGPNSGGTRCCLQRATIFSREVTIIDTPGLSAPSDPEVRKEIFRCINLSAPAAHAVLLVLRLDFTTRAEETVELMEEMFGRNVWSRTLILFTHQDRAEPHIQNQLQSNGAELKELLLEKVDGYQVLNNQPDHQDPQQVWDLLHEVTKRLSEQK
ncbi:uncharacterized protein LOC105921786 [Fundulus heteroclitus]|uniref:uncharacterized protein LOC105921786 n=1 Tax=Fundulus heteroclitus TaxID=8078 RepID=UPI00165B77F1|nr:uncharacterized protein LOC105921786 [Fundulus heteroclitus]